MDIVFLHGGGQGGWIWDETIAALESQEPGRHRCLALDVPGCGSKRERDRSILSYSDVIAELVADIREAGMAEVMLVGHSQAGTALPGMAAVAPDLFAKLVYVSCVAPPPETLMVEVVLAIHAPEDSPLHGIFGNPAVPAIDQFRAMFCNDMGAAEAEAFLAKLLRDQWPESVAAYTGWRYDHLAPVPSTYVLCLEDRILTPAAQAVFAQRFHCDRVVRIDAGHQVQNTRPHALAEVLRFEAVPAE